MKEIISYGGGTQSTAMILMGLKGKFDIKLDDGIENIRPDFAVFADTGGEPQFIYDYVQYFVEYCKDRYDFDIYVIKHKMGLVHRLLDEEHKNKSGKFRVPSAPPFFTARANGKEGMLMRQCTSDYKIHPITKFINSKLGKKEKYRLWMGISFEERTRMKISPIKRRTNYYPLVDHYIKRMDSVKYVQSLGVRTPQRSSCYFCPYHSDRYWKWLKKEHPSEFSKAVDFERKVQKRVNGHLSNEVFLHRSCVPLDQVRLKDDSQLNLFPELIDECDGYCGV